MEGKVRVPKERYIFLKGILESGLEPGFISDSHLTRSTEEDPRMLCFFDNIIQQELQGIILYILVSIDISLCL